MVPILKQQQKVEIMFCCKLMINRPVLVFDQRLINNSPSWMFHWRMLWTVVREINQNVISKTGLRFMKKLELSSFTTWGMMFEGWCVKWVLCLSLNQIAAKINSSSTETRPQLLRHTTNKTFLNPESSITTFNNVRWSLHCAFESCVSLVCWISGSRMEFFFKYLLYMF